MAGPPIDQSISFSHIPIPSALARRSAFMHRLPSNKTIWRFRFAAFLMCARWLLGPLAVGVMILALVAGDHRLAMLGGALLVLTLLIALPQWLLAARTGCPLCMTSVLANKHCATHRHARSVLGSYRLRVALAVLFRNSFHCPYCNEPTALEVREKKHRDRRA
jgi:hypothetical protein